MALGLAAVLSARGRTLLCDVNLDGPEISSILDLDDRKNLYHLAHRAELASPTSADVEEHLHWHDGVAVLPGITDPGQAPLITDRFIVGLLGAASRTFAHVVLDMGRAHPRLPGIAMASAVLWVVKPVPVGLACFDRAFERIANPRVPWLDAVRIVINQMAPHSMVGIGKFFSNEHIRSVGSVPYEPDVWRGVELGRGLRDLVANGVDEIGHPRDAGLPALRTRKALEALLRRVSLHHGSPTGAAHPET